MARVVGRTGESRAAGGLRARFQPAERIPVSRLVFDQIIAEIRDGRLHPGDRLPSELDLVAIFKVGRSSVREALRGLVTLGLVETRPGRGAVVAMQAESPLAGLRRDVDLEQLSRRALLDLLEVREALEGRAAALAAVRSTGEDVARLRRCHEVVEREVAAGRSYFRANSDFHRAVAAAAHNPVLADSIRLLVGQVRGYRERLMRELPSMPEQDVREHGELLDAIAAHDAERAGLAMTRHIRSFAALLTQAGGRHAA